MVTKQWLVDEMVKVKSDSDQLNKWVQVPEGSTIYRFNLDVPASELTAKFGKVFEWTLADGQKIGASKVLHQKLVKFFYVHGDLTACTIIRIGQGKETRWQVI